jgi:hypothetical protein
VLLHERRRNPRPLGRGGCQLNTHTQQLTKEVFTLKATHATELTAAEHAKTVAEAALEEVTTTQQRDKAYFVAEIHRLAAEANEKTHQMRELLSTNELLAEDRRAAQAESLMVKKDLAIASLSEKATLQKIKAAEAAQQQAFAEHQKSKQLIVQLTATISEAKVLHETQEKKVVHLQSQVNTFQSEAIASATENQALKTDLSGLKKSFEFLLSIIKSLLNIFNIKKPNEFSVLRKKMQPTEIEQLEYFLLEDHLKKEVSAYKEETTIFPTKLAYDLGWSLLQEIAASQMSVCKKLLRMQPLLIAHLTKRLVNEAHQLCRQKDQASLEKLHTILLTFRTVHDRVGEQFSPQVSLKQSDYEKLKENVENFLIAKLKNPDVTLSNQLEDLPDLIHPFIKGSEATLGIARTSVRALEVKHERVFFADPYNSGFFKTIENRPLPATPVTPTKIEAAIDEVRTGLTP